MTTAATLLWTTGFEFGLLAGGTTPQKTFLQVQGSGVAIDATSKRSGNYGIHLTPANGAIHNATMPLDGSTGSSSPFGRFYIKFITLPDANTILFSLRENAGGRMPVGFEWNAATSKIRPWTRDETGNTDYTGTDSSITFTTGVWYRIDWRFTRPTSTTRKVEWQIDGAAETDFTSAGGVLTTTLGQAVFGENTDRGGTTIDGEYYMDDFVAWDDNAAHTPVYPVGEGAVVGWSVDVDGTHSTAASFTDDLGNSPPASVYDRLDEVPHADNVTDDYVYQDTIGASDYLEVGVGTPVTDLFYARGLVRRIKYSGSATGTASMTWTIRDVTNASDLLTSTVTGITATGAWWASRNIQPYNNDPLNFAKAIVDAMVVRIGFSPDVTPFIRTHAIFFETEFLPGGGSDHWAWAEETLDSWQVWQ